MLDTVSQRKVDTMDNFKELLSSALENIKVTQFLDKLIVEAPNGKTFIVSAVESPISPTMSIEEIIDYLETHGWECTANNNKSVHYRKVISYMMFTAKIPLDTEAIYYEKQILDIVETVAKAETFSEWNKQLTQKEKIQDEDE